MNENNIAAMAEVSLGIHARPDLGAAITLIGELLAAVPNERRPAISNPDPAISKSKSRLLGWTTAQPTLERINKAPPGIMPCPRDNRFEVT
jgi:hypothetical protein